MKLLIPGNGNQVSNRKVAIEYIAKNIIDVKSIDQKAGNITSIEGDHFHVSAYAETTAAFVSTPGVDKSKNSIYESGLTTLMYRQIKNDKRSFIYEVDPEKIFVKPGSSSAEWPEVDKVATRIWVCTDEGFRLFDRRSE
jgi:hypothetical protein